MRLKTIAAVQFCISITLVIGSCNNSSTYYSTEKIEQSENITKFEAVGLNYLPTATYNDIVQHKFYTLSYAEKYEQSEWVAYQLKSKTIQNTNFDRPFFIEDNLVKTGSADWKNYKNSGYDKGHLCPAGDMKFSENAFKDTFYTSNISPQKHDFNCGIWNNLEHKVRYWSEKYNGLYVITGPVLTNDLETIGKENVAVPNYFYKILLTTAQKETKMIAFLVPSTDSPKPLSSFVVAVDNIEKITGIDFFSSLPDATENQLEKNNSYKDWSFDAKLILIAEHRSA